MFELFLQNVLVVLTYIGLSVVMLVVGMIWFDLVMTRGFKIRKELFEDDNRAAGLVVANFMIALVIVIVGVVLGDRQATHLPLDLLLSVMYFGLALVLFTVLRIAFKVMMKLVLKVDIDDEVFVQDNLAAARVEGAAYMAVGLLLGAAVY